MHRVRERERAAKNLTLYFFREANSKFRLILIHVLKLFDVIYGMRCSQNGWVRSRPYVYLLLSETTDLVKKLFHIYSPPLSLTRFHFLSLQVLLSRFPFFFNFFFFLSIVVFKAEKCKWWNGVLTFGLNLWEVALNAFRIAYVFWMYRNLVFLKYLCNVVRIACFLSPFSAMQAEFWFLTRFILSI